MPAQGKDAKNKASSAAQAASKSGGKGGKKKVRLLAHGGGRGELLVTAVLSVAVGPWGKGALECVGRVVLRACHLFIMAVEFLR